MDLENDFEILSNPEENNLEDMPTPCKTKRSFTMCTKLEVINFAQKTSVSEASRQYGIDRAIIILWRQKDEEFNQSKDHRKRLPAGGRKQLSVDLEEQLFQWITAQRDLKLAVTRKSIKLKAINLAFELGIENI